MNDLFSIRCDQKDSCEIEANNATFGSPCPDSQHVLEVIFTCIEGKFNETIYLGHNEYKFVN
jgi:hypothetical protein